MKLYRAILATEIDTQNLGCHTSKDFRAASKLTEGSNSYKLVRSEEQRKFIVWISAKNEQVNVDATAESNANYPHEKEVVLLPNQEVKIEVYCKGELIYKGKANTGTRYDKWVEAYI